jgi:aryl-alcohol dehydrogenase-like predicted oxidoreductase
MLCCLNLQQSLAQEAVAEYVKVAAKYDITPTELALFWCYSQPHVASTIIGATNVLQLRENVEAWAKRDKLTGAVLQDIDNIYRRYRDPSRI